MLKGLSPAQKFPQTEFVPYSNISYQWNQIGSGIMWKAYDFPEFILSESSRLTLQEEFIQPYITGITSMEADHIFEAVKEAGGACVIEAFLSSNASGKQKHRLVVKYGMLLYLVVQLIDDWFGYCRLYLSLWRGFSSVGCLFPRGRKIKLNPVVCYASSTAGAGSLKGAILKERSESYQLPIS